MREHKSNYCSTELEHCISKRHQENWTQFTAAALGMSGISKWSCLQLFYIHIKLKSPKRILLGGVYVFKSQSYFSKFQSISTKIPFPIYQGFFFTQWLIQNMHLFPVICGGILVPSPNSQFAWRVTPRNFSVKRMYPKKCHSPCICSLRVLAGVYTKFKSHISSRMTHNPNTCTETFGLTPSLQQEVKKHQHMRRLGRVPCWEELDLIAFHLYDSRRSMEI